MPLIRPSDAAVQVTMLQDAVPQTTFASGRYSKRKRTQVNYRMEEMDVDETDFESEEEVVKPKVRRMLTSQFIVADENSEAAQVDYLQAPPETQHLSLS